MRDLAYRFIFLVIILAFFGAMQFTADLIGLNGCEYHSLIDFNPTRVILCELTRKRF